MAEPIKAVAMMSGGLDSTLAAKIIKAQGIDVRGVNFYTGFCVSEHRRTIKPVGKAKARDGHHEALKAGADLEIPVEIIDVHKEYFPVVADPKYGRGNAFNPCVDCRLFMFQRAKEYMEEIGAQFVITGEVQGQRPMTQFQQTLKLLAKRSGLGDRLLRPLSARIMDPTLPEQMGWVDRALLEDISGRSRKRQMELAEELGITDYPQPAGGCCFLTDHNYVKRFKDLFSRRASDEIELDDVLLLKFGRHFRINDRAKAIVGRFEEENRFLGNYHARRLVLVPENTMGPTTIVDGEDAEPEDVLRAAAITARYCDAPAEGAPVRFDVTDRGRVLDIISVLPLAPDDVELMRL